MFILFFFYFLYSMITNSNPIFVTYIEVTFNNISIDDQYISSTKNGTDHIMRLIVICFLLFRFDRFFTFYYCVVLRFFFVCLLLLLVCFSLICVFFVNFTLNPCFKHFAEVFNHNNKSFVFIVSLFFFHKMSF